MPNIQLTNVFSNSQNNENLLSNSYEVLSGDNIVAVYKNREGDDSVLLNE